MFLENKAIDFYCDVPFNLFFMIRATEKIVAYQMMRKDYLRQSIAGSSYMDSQKIQFADPTGATSLNSCVVNLSFKFVICLQWQQHMLHQMQCTMIPRISEASSGNVLLLMSQCSRQQQRTSSRSVV